MPLFADFDINNPNPPLEGGLVGNPVERVMARMHRKLRESAAPRLRGLFGAFLRANSRISLSALAQALYLSTAQGRWLDSWGKVYNIPRNSSEADAGYRARISTALATTLPLNLTQLQALILSETGVTVTAKRGAFLNAGTGDWQGIADDAREISFNPSDTNFNLPSSKTITPESGAYQPSGVVIFVAGAYNAINDALIAKLLERVLGAGSWFDIQFNDFNPADRNRFALGWREIRAVDPKAVPFASGTTYLSSLPVFVRVS